MEYNNTEIEEFIERSRIEEATHLERIQEIERRINLDIEKQVKRWLKTNRDFKKVKAKKEATAMLIFKKADLSKYSLIYNNQIEYNEFYDLAMNTDGYTVIHIKNTNPHNNNRITLDHIRRKTVGAKKFYKEYNGK